jgi:ribosome-associated protein
MKTKTPKTKVLPILKHLCVALDDKKAGDIRVLRVSEQSSITDYLILASGTSDPHLRALRVELEKVLDSQKVHIVGMDTAQESGWLVIDAFDVMIHVLTPDNRDKYALENLWKDAEEIPLASILSSGTEETEAPARKPKAPKTPKTPKAAKPAKSAKAPKPAARKPQSAKTPRKKKSES